MDYRYTLTKDEYLDYCKYQMLGEPAFKKLRHRCWFIVPVGAVLLAVILHPMPWWGYAALVLLSLLWVLLVNKLVARAMIKAACQRRDETPDTAYRPLEVSLEEKGVRVNGTRRGLRDYRFFSDLILLQLSDDSCVVLPQRVFGTGKDDLRRVVQQLDGCCLKQKKTA